MKLHCLLISSLSVLFFNLFGCLAIYQACDAAGNCTCLGLFVETVKDAVSTVPKLFFLQLYGWICGNPPCSMF